MRLEPCVGLVPWPPPVVGPPARRAPEPAHGCPIAAPGSRPPLDFPEVQAGDAERGAAPQPPSHPRSPPAAVLIATPARDARCGPRSSLTTAATGITSGARGD
jgi:hypothetical protein